MATTFNKIYKKVANNGDSNDYQLISNVGSGGVPITVMQGATESSDGVGGLMPTSSMDLLGMLNNRGSYDLKFANIELQNESDGIKVSMKDDKSDSIIIPSIDSSSNTKNTGLVPAQSIEELGKLPNGYSINYDRAKLVYHSWNPNSGSGSANHYNNTGDTNETRFFRTETDAYGVDQQMCRYDLKGNGSTQAKPWIYPIFDMPNNGNKRSDIRKIINNGVSMYPCHTEYHSSQWAGTQNNKQLYCNVYKLVFDVPGLYGIYSRFWVRSTDNTNKRMSLCPYINDDDNPRYRGTYCSYAGYTRFYTNVFFQYFDKGDALTFGVWAEDTVSDSQYVSFCFGDIAIYIINWDGQLSLTKK